jgi:hypothetical protein
LLDLQVSFSIALSRPTNSSGPLTHRCAVLISMWFDPADDGE